MAISQAVSDKRSVGMVSKDVGGISVFTLGGIDVATGSGAPTAGASGDMKASPKGSLYIDVAAGKPYMKTSAADANVTFALVGTIET